MNVFMNIVILLQLLCIYVKKKLRKLCLKYSWHILWQDSILWPVSTKIHYQAVKANWVKKNHNIWVHRESIFFLIIIPDYIRIIVLFGTFTVCKKNNIF